MNNLPTNEAGTTVPNPNADPCLPNAATCPTTTAQSEKAEIDARFTKIEDTLAAFLMQFGGWQLAHAQPPVGLLAPSNHTHAPPNGLAALVIPSNGTSPGNCGSDGTHEATPASSSSTATSPGSLKAPSNTTTTPTSSNNNDTLQMKLKLLLDQFGKEQLAAQMKLMFGNEENRPAEMNPSEEREREDVAFQHCTSNFATRAAMFSRASAPPRCAQDMANFSNNDDVEEPQEPEVGAVESSKAAMVEVEDRENHSPEAEVVEPVIEADEFAGAELSKEAAENMNVGGASFGSAQPSEEVRKQPEASHSSEPRSPPPTWRDLGLEESDREEEETEEKEKLVERQRKSGKRRRGQTERQRAQHVAQGPEDQPRKQYAQKRTPREKYAYLPPRTDLRSVGLKRKTELDTIEEAKRQKMAEEEAIEAQMEDQIMDEEDQEQQPIRSQSIEDEFVNDQEMREAVKEMEELELGSRSPDSENSSVPSLEFDDLEGKDPTPAEVPVLHQPALVETPIIGEQVGVDVEKVKEEELDEEMNETVVDPVRIDSAVNEREETVNRDQIGHEGEVQHLLTPIPQDEAMEDAHNEGHSDVEAQNQLLRSPRRADNEDMDPADNHPAESIEEVPSPSIRAEKDSTPMEKERTESENEEHGKHLNVEAQDQSRSPRRDEEEEMGPEEESARITEKLSSPSISEERTLTPTDKIQTGSERAIDGIGGDDQIPCHAQEVEVIGEDGGDEQHRPIDAGREEDEVEESAEEPDEVVEEQSDEEEEYSDEDDEDDTADLFKRLVGNLEIRLKSLRPHAIVYTLPVSNSFSQALQDLLLALGVSNFEIKHMETCSLMNKAIKCLKELYDDNDDMGTEILKVAVRSAYIEADVQRGRVLKALKNIEN